MITENEFYRVIAKHPNVDAAFDKAIDALTKQATETAKPGLFAKFRGLGMSSECADAIGELLTSYGAATGCSASREFGAVQRIVLKAAENPRRTLMLRIANHVADE